MTGLEIDNFYAQDDKKYILENNQEFIKWHKEIINRGFYTILTLKELQDMINEIVLFFEFKYHNKMLTESIYYTPKSDNYYKSKELAKQLDINQLKYRLRHDYVQFLECSYFSTITLKKEKKNFYELNLEIIHINEDGTIDEHYLKNLKENNYLNDIDGINTATDLLVKFLSIPTKVDYSDLERLIFYHKIKLELRNKILELIPLAILYSKNSLPTYNYIRAKSFIRMFNKEYNLNLDTTEIDEIMNRNYKQKVKNTKTESSTPKKIRKLEIIKKIRNRDN